MQQSILYVDSGQKRGIKIKEYLSEYFEVIYAQNPEMCLQIAADKSPSLILSGFDLKMSGCNRIFQKIENVLPASIIVLLRNKNRNENIPANGYPTINTEDLEIKGVQFIKALLDQQLSERHYTQCSSNGHNKDYPCLIGNSHPLMSALKWIRKISNLSEPVLITGCSGTGKDIFARYIHYSGNRRDKSFYIVNCAAVTSNLFESEFFGHRKGAFTGATENLNGYFKAADGGTLVLDEVTEIELGFQAKLLRAIENMEINPVGSQKTVTVNTRIIAITNQNLEELIKQGKFREDLFYRLNVYQIRLPSLRERFEDLGSLIQYFVNQYCHKYGSFQKIKIDPEVYPLLRRLPFRGNIRELEYLVYKVMSTKKPNDQILTSGDFEMYISQYIRDDHNLSTKSLKEYLFLMEKERVIRALEKSQRNITQAAESLGISRQNLQYRLKKLSIEF
jgi:transcriptional regulator with PAS, ATPase and Fis domain